MNKLIIAAIIIFNVVCLYGQNQKIYFYEDFNQAKWSQSIDDDNLCVIENLPEGWMVYDSLGFDYFWHWSNQGPRGVFINPENPLEPQNLMLDKDFWQMKNSVDNGFMMLESDYFNTDSTGFIKDLMYPLSSYVQYGPVDLSESVFPLIEFNSLLRVCCNPLKGKMQLLVSTNYSEDNPNDATWESYDIDFLHSNFFSGRVQFDISNQVAGEPNVYFRWKQMNLSHYFWILDDIEIFEAPENEIALLDTWIEYNNVFDDNELPMTEKFSFNGGYTKIPEYTATKFVEVRAAVKNNGSQTQDVILNSILYKDGIEINKDNSNGIAIEYLASDTITLTTAFELEGTGTYQVSNSVSTVTADENYDNNSSAYTFEVTKNVYSRVYAENSDRFVIGGQWKYSFGGIESGEIYTQRFDFYHSSQYVMFKQMRFYLPSFRGLSNELEAIYNGNISVVARVFAPDQNNEHLPSVPGFIRSQEYELSLADTGSWITLDFIDEGDLFIKNGTYYVGLEVIVEPTVEYIQFGIGVEEFGPKQMFGGGQEYNIGNGTWSFSGENYAIELITQEYVNNIHQTEKVSVGLYPNPVNDNVYFTNASSIKEIYLFSIDGKLIQRLNINGNSVCLSDIKSGIYIISVMQNDGSEKTHKLVKE